jgi:hypothetical protein
MTLFLQEIAKKRAKVDKAGPSRPSGGAPPSIQANMEDPAAGAKVPEGVGAFVPPPP